MSLRAGREQLKGQPLTPRERNILQLRADGFTPRQISALLKISPVTVKSHLSHSFAKLDVKNIAGAIAQGLRQKLIR